MKTRGLSKPNIVLQVGMILLLGLALLVPGTATLPLIDRDEPRFAQATVEMGERGDWIVPYFNGHYRFDKPVLTYWVMRAGYALFGINEFGARFHSIISTLLIGLALFWAGLRWFSGTTGFAAAVGMLTSLQLIMNGRSCVADMPMVLAVTVAQICLYEVLRRDTGGRPRGWMWTFYAALGFGFLAKGPIALLVPALSAVLFRFVFWRRPLPWKNLEPHLGIPLMLIIISAWGIPAVIRTQGLFWDVGMGEHVVKRGMEVFNARTYIPIFYLLTAFLSLFPWIAFAGEGWYVLRRQWSRKNAFLVSWFLAPYVIFTFYATQLPHYVMPGFGAFFLILAQSLETPGPHRPWMAWWFGIVVAVPLLALIALLAGVVIIPFPGVFSPLRLCLWGGIGLLSGLILMAFVVRLGRRAWLWIGVVLIGLGMLALGNGLRRVSPAARTAPLFEAMPENTRCLGYRFTEGSLVFYSNARWEMTGDRARLEAFLKAPGPRLAVLLEKERAMDDYFKWQWRKWRGGPVSEGGEARGKDSLQDNFAGFNQKILQGLNLGRFTWVTLRILYRFDGTPDSGR